MDSGATISFEDFIASAPTVIEYGAAEQEPPCCLRKQRRMRLALALWSELQDEETVLRGIPLSHVRSARSVAIRRTMNHIVMPTGKSSSGFPVGDDYINRADVLRLCRASSPCSFWPEEDKLDVWEQLCHPFGNADFNPRAMEFNMEPYHDPTLQWPSWLNKAQAVHAERSNSRSNVKCGLDGACPHPPPRQVSKASAPVDDKSGIEESP